MQCGDAVWNGKWNGLRIRIGTSPLPESMQGVFWLTGQDDKSTVMSFAQSRDGCDLSRGRIQEDQSGFEYSVRVGGDRVWAFRNAGEAWSAAKELAYHFDLTGGTASAPKKFNIGASYKGFRTLPSSAGIFTMELQSAQQAAERGYAGSVVWLRRNIGDLKNYLLVQIADGTGALIRPAYEQWRRDCDAEGASPGTMFYHEACDAR